MTSLKNIYERIYQDSITDVQNPDHKNSDKGTVHSYIDYYDSLFSPFQSKKIRILEIGIQGGISLLLWKDYFKQAEVVGIDIDIKQAQKKVLDICADPTSGISLIEADAADYSILDKIHGNFDIIIDDGSHLLHHQLASFKFFKDRLNLGGIYIIEDIGNELNARTLNQKIPNSEIVDLRSVKGRWDDLILVYRK
jgi:cephalosporin hydroxylase